MYAFMLIPVAVSEITACLCEIYMAVSGLTCPRNNGKRNIFPQAEKLPNGGPTLTSGAPDEAYFLVNGFFTIGPQNRDLGALLPGNDSYGRPASFLFA